jgi:transposase
MIHIHLPTRDVKRLTKLFRTTADRKLRDRLQIILMAHRGRARHDIATDLGINRRTVSRWLNAYCDRGVDGLRPRQAKGHRCHIPSVLAATIQRWVIDGPMSQGLDRANWTHEELADQLFNTYGIRTSRSAMQRFCAKIGIRLYRPTYRYLRGDPVKQANAKEEIAQLRKKPPRVNSSY